MEKTKLELYWSEIPIGKRHPATYSDLVTRWGKSERQVRNILHQLSTYDNGDNYILVRSASGKGFYRTDDTATIRAYRKECLHKGKSIFAPLKKIDRVLNVEIFQLEFENNLRVVRESKDLKQSTVCKQMKQFDRAFDKSMLSKMENGFCLPTPLQLEKLSEIYGCKPFELVVASLYQ